MVIGPAVRRDGVDLAQRREQRVVRPSRLRSVGCGVGAGGGLIDIQQLKLVVAPVADVAHLQHKFETQFLLEIQVPELGVRSPQVRIDARDVKGRLGSTSAKYRYAHVEWDGRCRGNSQTASRYDRILGNAFLEIVQWNGVVVDAVSRSNYGLPSGNQLNRGSPGKGDAGAKISLGGVVDFSSGQMACHD